MANLDGLTDYFKIDFPVAFLAQQDITIFALIETSNPPNDTGSSQQIVGMHGSGNNFRYDSIRILDSDAKFSARQKLQSAAGQEAISAAASTGATLYAICYRWNYSTKTVTLNVNQETKVTSSSVDNPDYLASAFVVGASPFTSAKDYHKGKSQHAALWIGTELSDAEVLSLADGSVRPDAITTTRDYYYPLVDNVNSGVSGTAITSFGSPVFDSVDLWPSSGLTLDSTPTDNRVTESRSVVVSTPAVTPTTGNTEVKLTDDSGQAATVDSVTGSDPYTINYTFPRSTAKLFDATGYPIYVEVAAENVTSSNVPFLPVTTQRFIDLSSPVATAGTYGAIYAGAVAATGDQRVHDIVSTSESIPLDADGAAYGAEQDFWAIRSQPIATQTATFYLIEADGTVGVEDTITFEVDVAPILSLPTGTKTGSSTATGTITTDEDNGTLYYYASTNTSETLATIKASGNNQAVSATGLQNVSFSSLSSSTVYYAHYVHTDTGDNDSNVESSTSFTTDAAAPSVGNTIVSSIVSPIASNIVSNV